MSDETVTSVRERLRNPSGGMNTDVFLYVILGVDFAIAGAIALALQPGVALWIVPAVVGIPLAAFWLITLIMWKPWERRFPAMPQRTDAVVKLGQSVTLGRIGNMNNCIALAADANYLHMIPFSMMRVVGARVVSVPWDRFTEVGAASKFKFMPTKGVIDGRIRFAAPEWAMGVGRVESVSGQ